MTRSDEPLSVELILVNDTQLNPTLTLLVGVNPLYTYLSFLGSSPLLSCPPFLELTSLVSSSSLSISFKENSADPLCKGFG